MATEEQKVELDAKLSLKEANKMLMTYENNLAKGSVPQDQIEFVKERIAYWGKQVDFFQKIAYGA